MLSKEKLNKLYAGVVSGDELTTQKLSEYGFDGNDITKLLNQNILQRVKRGYYSFVSATALVERGKEFYQSEEYMKVNKYFSKSYEIDPSNRDVLLQFILTGLAKDDYELVFKYLDDLYKNSKENKKYIVENNIILFLLSINNELPERYKAYFEKLKVDYFFDDEIDKDISDIEKSHIYQDKKYRIKCSILNHRFALALAQISEYNEMTKNSDTYIFVLKRLIRKVNNYEEDLINEIIKQLENEKYEEGLEVINKIISKALRFPVGFVDNNRLKIIKYLLETIIKINDTNVIPNKTICKTNYSRDLIKTGNFDAALTVEKNRMEKYYADPETYSANNVVYRLLSIINNKIEEVENEKENVPFDEESTQISNSNFDKPLEYYFGEMINCLFMGDIDNALEHLTIYLKKTQLEKYKKFITNLIKISLIEKDKSFSKPINTLINIAKGNFDFSSIDFVKEFYDSLSKNECDKAQIYIDILEDEEIFNLKNEFVGSLKAILTTHIRIFSNQTNLEEKSDSYIDNLEKNEEDERPLFKQEKTYEYKPSPSLENSSPSFGDSKENNFMNSKINKLKKNGIIILKHMSSSKTKQILEEVEKMPDVVAFTINIAAEERIVLRYRLSEYINYKETIDSARSFYNERNYEASIEEYKRMLRTSKPNYYIYACLGFCYMKLEQNSMAIDYFNIANYLSKQENKNVDYTKMIEILTGEYFDEDRKKEVKMSLEDFDSDVDLSYGIDRIEELKKDIKSGYSIDDVCNNFNLSEEQKLIFMLMLAKEYYYDQNYEQGDAMLKKVERTKGKTKAVMSLFEEVRKNKKFYKNRVRTRK